MIELEFHPYANIFPLMHENSRDFMELTESLRTTTMLVPVVLYTGRLLDGRNRYRAYQKHPDIIELRTEEFIGSDEEALHRALALNNNRRHLDEGQRALSALRLANTQSQLGLVASQKYACQVFNVSLSTIKMAFDIHRSDQKEHLILLDMIEQDDLAISAAHNIMKKLHPSQWEQAALDGKTAKQWIKKIKRQEQEVKFANGTVAANRQLENAEMVFGVIYIDPPWKFETYSENGMDRSAENHYPTMTDDDIRAMQIPAAEDCVMFMWATIAKLDKAMEVMQGWGFEYKSAYVWHKMKAGTGYWSANEAELLLVGTKGKVPAPLPDQRMKQVITAAQGKHSEKPEAFADGITKMFPNVAKVDMFARKKDSHKGENWFYWGNEINDEPSAKVSTGKTTRKRNGKKNGNGHNGIAPGATEETESQESISP